MNTFYRSLIELWLKCKTIRGEDEINHPGSEIIWNNENIKYNARTLYFKHFICNGYTNVSSLHYGRWSTKTNEILVNDEVRQAEGGGSKQTLNAINRIKSWNR